MKAPIATLIKAGALGALALASSSCLFQVAGNGSEVENAVVLGRVVMPSGEPAAGVSMQILPEDYDALKDAAPGRYGTTTTDARGHFELRSKRGRYNVYAVHHATGLKLLVQSLDMDDKVPPRDLGQDNRLSRPGAIRMALPVLARAGDYVYVPGTPLTRRVDSAQLAAGYAQVDEVPTGRIDKVVLATGKADSVRGLGNDVAVSPGGVTDLPYTAWRKEALVAIRVREEAPGMGADVSDIPLLLRLDSANFDFSQAAPGGSDLRFTRDDGKPLSWHIQSWDAAAARARVWVRLDTVFAAASAQKIRMYWGAPDTAKPVTGGAAAVFPAASGWLGAWHLDARPEAGRFPGTGGLAVKAAALGALATADSVLASDSGVGVHPGHGVLGSGVHLNGTDAYLAMEDTVVTPPGFTFSTWIRTTTTEGGKIAGFVMPDFKGKVGDRPGDWNFDRVLWMTNDGKLRAGFTMKSADTSVLGSWQDFVSAKRYNDGQWHHVTYSLSATEFLLYVDGEKVVSYTGSINPIAKRGYWRVGYAGNGMWDPTWTSEHFRGSLDEVRILHASRSGDWLRLDQVSQDPGSALLRVERH